MKTTVMTAAAQGDVLFVAIPELPMGTVEVPATGGRHVLARGDSASGDHTITADNIRYYRGTDDRTAYIVASSHANVVHGRATDTHETVTLSAGIWLVRRQREHTPAGFRRVED